jgi:hypothetical protein
MVSMQGGSCRVKKGTALAVPKGNGPKNKNAPTESGRTFLRALIYYNYALLVKGEKEIFWGANATLKIKDFVASEDWFL